MSSDTKTKTTDFVTAIFQAPLTRGRVRNLEFSNLELVVVMPGGRLTLKVTENNPYVSIDKVIIATTFIIHLRTRKCMMNVVAMGLQVTTLPTNEML